MDILGKKVKDKITGLEGIVIGKCIYLFGCNQYGISPAAKDGEIKAAQWIDEGRIKVIGAGVTEDEVKGEKNGGINSDCPQGVY